MYDGPVIDAWAPILPVPDMMRHASENFPDKMLGSLRIFFRTTPTAETARELMRSVERPEADVVADIEAAGITRTLVTGFDEKTHSGKTFMSNECVAALVERHPGRFIPFAGADIARGYPAVRELDALVREHGFRGLSLRPYMTDVVASDPAYYALYAKCAELGVPVSIHTSANWATTSVNDLGHPRHLDRVAADFPELTLILSHAGYPWVLEAVQLAWKYPNVYLELAAHRPKYLALPGTGWEPLMRFGPRTIRDKVLFGSGAFLLGRSPVEIVDEFRALPLPDDVMAAWMHDNAARVFGDA